MIAAGPQAIRPDFPEPCITRGAAGFPRDPARLRRIHWDEGNAPPGGAGHSNTLGAGRLPIDLLGGRRLYQTERETYENACLHRWPIQSRNALGC